MCRHVPNAQVSVRSLCCRQWFDCPECHAEVADHPLQKTTEMTMICKKCRKAFRKDLALIEECDEFCPHCDNRYVLDAAPAPAAPQAAGLGGLVGLAVEELELDPEWAALMGDGLTDGRIPAKRNALQAEDEIQTYTLG